MLLLAWVFSVSWLAGYVTGLLVAPTLEPRKRTRPPELAENGHQGGRAVPPVAEPYFLDPLAHQ